MLITDAAIADPITFLANEDYAWGSLQVIKYDWRNPIFKQPYLYNLYERTRLSGRRRMGSLPSLFCGMPNLSPDAICAYLHSVGPVIMGEWRPSSAIIDPNDPLPPDFESLIQPEFHALGYFFPSVITQSRDGQANMAMGAYCFFPESWSSPKQLILTYLGLAYFFREFRLVNLHGIRYADNKLTARWMGRFGFRDIGTLPNYMIDQFNGQLQATTISTLDRETLEINLRRVLQELRRLPDQ